MSKRHILFGDTLGRAVEKRLDRDRRKRNEERGGLRSNGPLNMVKREIGSDTWRDSRIMCWSY